MIEGINKLILKSNQIQDYRELIYLLSAKMGANKNITDYVARVLPIFDQLELSLRTNAKPKVQSRDHQANAHASIGTEVLCIQSLSAHRQSSKDTLKEKINTRWYEPCSSILTFLVVSGPKLYS